VRKIYLTKEEESILNGEYGDLLSKLMELVVRLGDSYGAEKLIEIVSAHTVLNFGVNFVNAAAKILHKIAEEGLQVKVRTTADPIIDLDYKEELKMIIPIFKLHNQLMDDLAKIGVHGFTCTPYFLDNEPKLGDHCAWSESSAVIYLNSILGARSNREGGLLDIACAITGKTPYNGLHKIENRKGELLFKISADIDKLDLFNLTSIGLRVGEIAGNKVPVIEGLKNITTDNLKNLGAAAASTGAVALIHIIGVTPEAKDLENAFQGDKPEDIIEIDNSDLKEVRERYSTLWKKPPSNITIGCPHLSEEEVIDVLNKVEGKKVIEGTNFWICTNEVTKRKIINSQYNKILENSRLILTSLCPLLTTLPRPLTTNSAKTCFYSNATYRNIDDCIKIATEGVDID
jgi:predicted aconitase